MNKSEELCKLLGIKAKVEAFDPYFKTTELFETREQAIEMGLVDVNPEAIYPDLTKPSNFVKLIELQVSKNLIVGRYFQGSGTYGVPFSSQWYDRESFLNILIDCLARTDEWCARNRNRIIKKIQQTEWDY